jgi:tetratricopeptide (TPR) repeat protein
MPDASDLDPGQLEQQAMAAQAARDFAGASMLHERAINAAKALDRPRLAAVLMERLGATLVAAGQVQKAVIAFESGLRALDGVLDLGKLQSALVSLTKDFLLPHGVLVPPDLDSAASTQDLGAAEADPALVVRLLVDIGDAYLAQGQDKVARLRYEAALARPEAAGAPRVRVQALTGIALAARGAGDLATAEAKLAEAQALADANGFGSDAPRLRSAQAQVVLEAGLGRAEAAFREAASLHEKHGDPRGQGRALVGLGRALLGAWRLAEARDAFKEAARTGGADPITSAFALWGLGQVERASGRLEEAAAALQQSLDLMEVQADQLTTDEGQVTFLQQAAAVYDELVAVHLIRARTDAARFGDALAVAERARGRALRALMGYRAGVASASAAQDRPPPPSRFEQSAVGIATGAPLLGESKGSAAPPLARLVFHTMSDQTAVFAVTADGKVTGSVLETPLAELSLAIGRVRAALGVDQSPRGLRDFGVPDDAGDAPDLDDPAPLLDKLFADLLAPVIDALPAGDAPVLIEPHGPLWLLPFAALRLPDGSALVDRWPIVHGPSADTIAEVRRAPHRIAPDARRALVVGNPALGSIDAGSMKLHLGPLPGAEEEARRIAAMFPEGRAELLTGAAADRATVEARMPGVDVVHLATHAVALPSDPLASFVALSPPGSDGMLMARRVLGLSLRAAAGAADQNDTDLVVLSACQTGLGLVAGDGVIGLTRAFLVAGARSVVVSLWSVSDDATAALMTAFYDAYLRHGDKAAALRAAMVQVRAMPDFSAPRCWAPFVLVGAEA